MKKFNKLNPVMRMIFFLIGLFVSIYLLIKFLGIKQEGFGNPTKCTYYYMDGCGHCKTFTPVWNQFTQSYSGSVKFNKVNMKDAGNDLKKYNVEGFPTVVVIDSAGNYEHYDGPRTVEGLKAFFG